MEPEWLEAVAECETNRTIFRYLHRMGASPDEQATNRLQVRAIEFEIAECRTTESGRQLPESSMCLHQPADACRHIAIHERSSR